MFMIIPDRFRKLRKSGLQRECYNELHGSENNHNHLSIQMMDKFAVIYIASIQWK